MAGSNRMPARLAVAGWQVDDTPEPVVVPVPKPDKVLDGAAVLDEARAFLARFAILPSPAALDAVTLWCAHTWCVNAFNASPRLAVLSDGPGSGKTRLIELAGLLSRDATQEVSPTGPGLIALISQRQPTIFIDEADCVWGTSGNSSQSQLRAVLNSGYRQGAEVTRRSGGAFVKDRIYAAVGFGGIGILPSTLMSRSVVVRMEKRKPGQRLDKYMPRLHSPLGSQIGQSLGEWIGSVSLDLASAWPELPDGVEDRAAECWEPLLSVADAAGGAWPERARKACEEFALGSVAEPVESPGQRVLRDLRTVWGADGNLPTAELIGRLFALDGAPWAAMWPVEAAPRELSALLGPAGVRPVKIRLGARTAQGYKRQDLAAAWDKLAGPDADVPAVPGVPDSGEQGRAA